MISTGICSWTFWDQWWRGIAQSGPGESRRTEPEGPSLGVQALILAASYLSAACIGAPTPYPPACIVPKKRCSSS
ncbi:ORFS371W.iORF1 [Human betaherpesvirus 5]|nr:ORFS371W.iORF1 [Human betaherpesvirus 5]QHX40750.1 ORFS371W.iORF1 [Human betaherpesvirus 5]